MLYCVPSLTRLSPAGGAADKGGLLQVGDELLSVNTVDLTVMARIEAWNFLKKLPDGTVNLIIRKKLPTTTDESTASAATTVAGVDVTTTAAVSDVASNVAAVVIQVDVKKRSSINDIDAEKDVDASLKSSKIVEVAK